MTSKVTKCSVDTCKYYSNNDCVAPEIEVNFDSPSVKAHNSKETMCKTFQNNSK